MRDCSQATATNDFEQPSGTILGRLIAGIAFALVVGVVGSGCTSKSTTQQLCDRMQSCNVLAAGYSVDECAEDLESVEDDLPANQRDEFEHEMEGCLDHPSCNGFQSCIDDYLADE